MSSCFLTIHRFSQSILVRHITYQTSIIAITPPHFFFNIIDIVSLLLTLNRFHTFLVFVKLHFALGWKIFVQRKCKKPLLRFKCLTIQHISIVMRLANNFHGSKAQLFRSDTCRYTYHFLYVEIALKNSLKNAFQITLEWLFWEDINNAYWS